MFDSNAPLEIRMPPESPTIEFVNSEKTQNCPFVVYADLEAINVTSALFPQTKCRTRKIEKQYAASFGAVLVDSRSWLNFAYISMRFWKKSNFNHYCWPYSNFNLVVLSVIFVSASGIVKQGSYRGLDCIAKLLDMLRDWLFWR